MSLGPEQATLSFGVGLIKGDRPRNLSHFLRHIEIGSFSCQVLREEWIDVDGKKNPKTGIFRWRVSMTEYKRVLLGLGGGMCHSSYTYFMCIGLPDHHLQSSMLKCPHTASTKVYFHNCAASSDHSQQPFVSDSTGKARAPLLKQYFVMVLGGL